MRPLLPPLRLTGAVILRDGELQHRSIGIAEGRITRGPLPEVDLSGYYVLPGIIDLHGDSFEHHLAPRPGVPVPLATGLAAFDREAAANGVTTAFLAQRWSWEGGKRSPDFAVSLAEAMQVHRAVTLTDLRLQIRAETRLVGESERLIDFVARYGVGYVVFNDHAEELMQVYRTDRAAFDARAREIGIPPEHLHRRLEDVYGLARVVPRHLCRMAEAFDRLGVIYGSHDDPDGETREFYSMIGARVAEFPLSRRAAAAAHAMMCPVIMSAPNAVRGASSRGKVSAIDLIAEGICDALVSDYHMPALAHAAWKLVDRGFLSLPKAWAMISATPAELMRLTDRGKLDPGRRADLVVVNAATRGIEATIAGGRLTYLSGDAAHRFLGQPEFARLAAE